MGHAGKAFRAGSVYPARAAGSRGARLRNQAPMAGRLAGIHRQLPCQPRCPAEHRTAIERNPVSTPTRTIRIDDPLWTDAGEAVRQNGDESITEVIRDALQKYVADT